MKSKSEDNIAGHQFRWLRAIRDGIALEQGRKKSGARRAMLTHLDALLAIDLTEFMQGRLECFRSASMLARACGCSESAADAGLRRLVAAGFLEKLPPAEGDTNGKGRPASRYRVPAIFPVLAREKSEAFSTSQEGEKTGDAKAFSTAGQVILSTFPEGNDQIDDQKGAKAPTAPLPPSLCISDVDLEERCGSVAHERDHPPLPSEGPQEGDEPILEPIDRDLPEIPDDVADRFRQEDEALPPPETRYPEDDPETLAEVENLTGHDPAIFVELLDQGFIGCDQDSADKLLAIVALAARRTAVAFPSQPNAVAEFFIAPLLKTLTALFEERGYDPDTIEVAIADFRHAMTAGAAAPKEETERRVAHG